MTTDTATDSSVNNPVDLNITGLVDAWRTDSTTNHGLALKIAGESTATDGYAYYSRRRRQPAATCPI
ncbi:hypothetical protein [Actinacidiphila glaucinigra]|uniref:hypothetical protein n=1 Tax=Actinacidiphila glaucinigra TaxID=235986 RepID=UPI00381458DF